MKRIIQLVVIALLMSSAAMAQTYNITFRVDMNEVGDAFTTPEVNGTFNGWCGGCAPMSDGDGDGIWELTIPLAAGFYEYKFAYDSWAGSESLIPGSSCTITTGEFTNRALDVTGDATLDAVCWGSCLSCSDIITYAVTFSVDMNEVAGPFTTPEVNGSWDGWCGGCTPLSDPDGDGIWSTTKMLEPGYYEYKFAYDSWSGDESLTPGDPCTVTTDIFTNRFINVSDDADLGVVCWASCEACETIGLEQMDLPVTFEDAGVDYGVIGFEGAEASSIVTDPTDASNTVVQVIKSASAMPWAGTTVTNAAEEGFATPIPFTAENTQMTVRVWSPDAGIQVRLKVEDHLDPTHSVETEATSTVAGDWETLTFNFSNEAPGTAELNLAYTFDKASIFFNFGVDGATAGEKTYYFDDIYFAEGGGASSYTVTFWVDMNEVLAPFTTPEVNGSWDGWCGGCTPMEDPDGDNIWTATKVLDAGYYEYKFAYDSWTGSETLTPGDPCTVTTDIFTNRFINVSEDTELGVVCWESCEACTGEEPVMITFSVNMNTVADPFTTPEVNGSWDGWCGGCTPMEDPDGDGIWTATKMLSPGYYEYKFAYDSWTGQETLTPGDPCTVTTDIFTNRFIDAVADEVLPVVCWESCENCAEDCNAPVDVVVTDITSSGATISWTGTSGADQYLITLADFAAGTSGKQRTGPATTFVIEDMLAPSTEYSIRIKSICYDLGLRSEPSETVYFTTAPMRSGGEFHSAVYPNPTAGNLQVQTNLSGTVMLTVTGMTGQLLMSTIIEAGSTSLDLSMFADGLYMIRLDNGQSSEIFTVSLNR